LPQVGRLRLALAVAVAVVVGLAPAASGAAPHADSLLSQGKPATSSSTENATFPASNAVDGNTGTRWSSAFGDPQWITVDLGATAQIDQVKLAWEAAYAKAYQIQVSPDNATWTSVYTTSTGAGGTETLTLSGSGRYVRMLGSQRATQWGYSLFEFQVFGTGGSGGGGGTIPGQPTQVTTDSDIPWGLAFLPDGSALISERDTFQIVHVSATGQKTTVGTVPNASGTGGEGGLLGIAVAPTFATDHWLYVFHTSPSDNRIVRFQYVNGGLSGEQVLLSGIARNQYHNGGRLAFGPDGKLYATTGDAQNGANAQNTSSLNGKVLRLNPDGTVPADNPFAGKYVWSYGHRNVQGLAWDSQGRLWESELGDSTQDEVNLIVKGGNYGWPTCEGTHDHDGSCNNPNFVPPKRTFTPTGTNSPSGLAIVGDVLFMSEMTGQQLLRMPISGSSLPSQQAYYSNTYGRLRTAAQAPDGGLWLTTSNGDKNNTPGQLNNLILHVALTN
jgi:glucose/arabinose dehydrogenase